MLIPKFSLEVFAPHIGSTFDVVDHATSATITSLTLTETVSVPGDARYEQFSVRWQGTVDAVLPQGTYHLVHPFMGELDLFLVPIGRDAQNLRYESAFSVWRAAS